MPDTKEQIRGQIKALQDSISICIEKGLTEDATEQVAQVTALAQRLHTMEMEG